MKNTLKIGVIVTAVGIFGYLLFLLCNNHFVFHNGKMVYLNDINFNIFNRTHFNKHRKQVDKIYSVEEIVELFNTKSFYPLKNKKIKITAVAVDRTLGLLCGDYIILTDPKYLNLYKKKYNKNLTQAEKEQIKNIPTILTGRTIDLPNGMKTIKYEMYKTIIYQGHFFDNWAIKKCKDGEKRFIVEGILEK